MEKLAGLVANLGGIGNHFVCHLEPFAGIVKKQSKNFRDGMTIDTHIVVCVVLKTNTVVKEQIQIIL